MNYNQMRTTALTGDVLLVEGRSFFSRFIRVVTGQNFSHVAMLMWLGDGLYVAEMAEGKGFVITPASQWTQSSGYLYYGRAPSEVSENHVKARTAILELRGKKYGYMSLFKVWISQLTGKAGNNKQLVCSTAVQHVWEQCGYQFDQIPDPGDFARLCDYISKVET